MAMDFSTINASNFEVVGPQGQTPAVNFVSVDSLTGAASYDLTKTWGHEDNGDWTWRVSSTAQAQDQAGNKVLGGSLAGTFTVNIPIPTDTTRPTWTTSAITPSSITTSGQQTVVLSGVYADT